MTASSFQSLEDAVADEHFPEVDLALRRGRHVGRDDGTAYDYLVDALDHLEPFYRRFGCELIQRADGYFYLLPSGDRLGHRQLTAGEMLVGQTLALMYLDPATLQHSGMVQRETLLQRLSGLLPASLHRALRRYAVCSVRPCCSIPRTVTNGGTRSSGTTMRPKRRRKRFSAAVKPPGWSRTGSTCCGECRFRRRRSRFSKPR